MKWLIKTIFESYITSAAAVLGVTGGVLIWYLAKKNQDS